MAPSSQAEQGSIVRAPSRRGGDALTWLLIALPLAVATVSTAWVGLGVDVQYVLGGLITAEAGGVGSAVDVFVHRPLVYRLLLGLLQEGAEATTADPAGLAAQLVVRIEAYLLVVAAGVTLWWGLRRHLPESTSRVIALAAVATLCLAPNFHTLTADWVGVGLAMGAIGATLAPRNLWLGASLGGLLLWATIAVKVATLPWAVLALGVVGLLACSRAVRATIAAFVFTAIWVGLTAWLDPLELTWLRDSVRANHSSPIQTGFGATEATELARVVANLTIVSPIVIALPAALTVAVLNHRHRGIGFLVAILAVVLSLASGIGQGEWYAYHFVGLPVFSATIWAYAVCVASPDIRLRLIAGPALAGLMSAALLAQDLEWRREVFALTASVYLAGATVLVIAVLLTKSGRRVPGDLPASTLVLMSTSLAICLLAAGLPASAYAFDGFNDRYTNYGLLAAQTESSKKFADVRQRIGADTPVLYLAYGSKVYLFGNPTPCRYASPVFISRSAHDERIRELSTYRDNLSCYTASTPAQYLVVDRAWSDVNLLEATLRDQINSIFDCSRALEVEAGGARLELCPRAR